MAPAPSRRLFLHATGAAGLGYFLTAPAESAGRVAGAADRLRVAGIGVGGKGRSDIEHAGELMDVVALCDVDEADGHLGGAARKFPKARTFTDYRRLFDAAGKDIDAAVISAPDHHHAAAASRAIRLGKHVYVQKPLTRTVFEAHHLRRLAAEHKVCTQMGNQGTAEDGLRRAVEVVRAGVLGDVAEAHVWTDRPAHYWVQAPRVVARPGRVDPVPAGLHWDEFLGPAPARPFARGAYHSQVWRGFWDFGTGAIGDMACHTANLAFMALRLGHPAGVSAAATDVNPETGPSSAHVVLRFPARGPLPAVALNWYEGKKEGRKLTPPGDLLAKVLGEGEKPADSGSILVGTKGLLYSPSDYGASFRLVAPGGGDLGRGMNLTRPESLPANGGGDRGHKREWVDAIRAGDPRKALSNFDYAGLLAAAFLLGNVAIRAGKGFDFDGETLECKGCPEAARFVKQEARKGWELV